MLLRELLNRVIVVSENIQEYGAEELDPGMKFQVEKVSDEVEEGTDCYELTLNFEAFEEHNKALSDIEWHKSEHYPKDKRYALFVSSVEPSWPFKVIDPSVDPISPVVLSASAWKILLDKVGRSKLEKWGVKPS